MLYIVEKKLHSLTRREMDELVQIFIEVFAAPPRNEVWSNETAEEFIVKHLKGGEDFLAVARSSESPEQPLGFLLAMNLSNHEIAKLDNVAFPSGSHYFSTLAVLSQGRRQGIGSALMEFYQRWATASGYTTIVVRTRMDARDMNSLRSRRGANLAHAYVDEVGGSSAERGIYCLALDSQN